jgi:hypothetical protein
LCPPDHYLLLCPVAVGCSVALSQGCQCGLTVATSSLTSVPVGAFGLPRTLSFLRQGYGGQVGFPTSHD